jgi:hypothetical protein
MAGLLCVRGWMSRLLYYSLSVVLTIYDPVLPSPYHLKEYHLVIAVSARLGPESGFVTGLFALDAYPRPERAPRSDLLVHLGRNNYAESALPL